METTVGWGPGGAKKSQENGDPLATPGAFLPSLTFPICLPFALWFGLVIICLSLSLSLCRSLSLSLPAPSFPRPNLGCCTSFTLRCPSRRSHGACRG